MCQNNTKATGDFNGKKIIQVLNIYLLKVQFGVTAMRHGLDLKEFAIQSEHHNEATGINNG